MNWEKWAAFATVFGFPLLIITLVYSYQLDGHITNQLTEIKQVAESQNTIALNEMFFNDPTNIGIIGDIYNDQPILISHRGRYTEAALDKYISDFDTIDLVYQEQLMSEDQLCDSFSYYIEATADNKEIKNYLSIPVNQDPEFAQLEAIVTQSKDQYCVEQ